MKNFLVNQEETGRFIVYSTRTGISYYVEPLTKGSKVAWGDMDPATKNISGNYGGKYTGAIKEGDSLITEANGFKNITTLGSGESPHSAIEQIDEIRYQEGHRPKNP